MKASIENGKLVVKIETSAPVASASGKTLVVASSHGNVETEAEIDGKKLTVGVNAYIGVNGNHPYAKNEDKSTKITGKELVITLPLQAAALSASGKTYVIASTHGNIVTNAKVDGKNVIIGLNAYYSAK